MRWLRAWMGWGLVVVLAGCGVVANGVGPSHTPSAGEGLGTSAAAQTGTGMPSSQSPASTSPGAGVRSSGPVSSSSAPTQGAAWIPASQVADTAQQWIAAARQTVQVEMYELGNPRLVEALIAAERRGVAVQVILDPTERQSQASGQTLANAGVPVRWFRVAHGIDHVKLLVVDHTDVLTGGVNWGWASGDTTDADVALPQDALAAAIFAADWQTAGGHPTPDPTGAGGLTGSAISRTLIALLAGAHRTIDLAANYASDWTVQDALAAAVHRGVAVHVLLNPETASAPEAGRWLAAHDVTVRWATGPYLHAKVALVDGTQGLVGSANFSYHGLAINHELDVALPGAVVPAAQLWFDQLWAEATAVPSTSGYPPTN